MEMMRTLGLAFVPDGDGADGGGSGDDEAGRIEAGECVGGFLGDGARGLAADGGFGAGPAIR